MRSGVVWGSKLAAVVVVGVLSVVVSGCGSDDEAGGAEDETPAVDAPALAESACLVLDTAGAADETDDLQEAAEITAERHGEARDDARTAAEADDTFTDLATAYDEFVTISEDQAEDFYAHVGMDDMREYGDAKEAVRTECTSLDLATR